jgi:hypothetical protein
VKLFKSVYTSTACPVVISGHSEKRNSFLSQNSNWISSADYGRKSKIVEFNKERIGEMINKVEKMIMDIEKELKNSGVI